MAVSAIESSSQQLKVGDQVLIQWVMQKVKGVITEDRGPIGRGGRRLYGVEFRMDEGEPFAVEVPADRIEKVMEGGESDGCR